MTVWRVGRKLGVTLYRDEVFVGHVSSRDIAAEIVAALNDAEDRRAAMWPPVCPECLRHVMPDGGGRYMPHRDGISEDWCAGSRTEVNAEVLAAWRSTIGQPRDAERRSEATPKKDLQTCERHVGHCPDGCCCDPGSRVDPYDTKKGGITEP